MLMAATLIFSQDQDNLDDKASQQKVVKVDKSQLKLDDI